MNLLQNLLIGTFAFFGMHFIPSLPERKRKLGELNEDPQVTANRGVF